jgi:hypothetical protein
VIAERNVGILQVSRPNSFAFAGQVQLGGAIIFLIRGRGMIWETVGQ